MDLVGIEIEESRERLSGAGAVAGAIQRDGEEIARAAFRGKQLDGLAQRRNRRGLVVVFQKQHAQVHVGDRKSTRLNSSHGYISYAVFCLKKKKIEVMHERVHQTELLINHISHSTS